LTGSLWDRCPVWYRDHAPQSHVARIAVRWGRRWAPGISVLTPCGDDVVSIVRACDRRIEAAVADEARAKEQRKR